MTSAATSKKLAHFAQLINRLIEEQPKLLLSELYHLILDETGYVRDLRKEGTEESMSRIENLEEFDTLLQEFEEDQLENLSEGDREQRRKELLSLFIEQSTLVSEKDEGGDVQGSAVKLMTLHSSKGLEFPVVFLVGMEEGLFPSIKPWEETPDEDIEEERRLCYVGMTRAREKLYLMNVVVRRIWGNVSYQEPSRFFTEIPEEYIEFRDLSFGSRSGEFRIGSSRQFGYSTSSTYSSLNTNSSRPSLRVVRDEELEADEMVGRQMLHPEYGRGTVIALEGMGKDQKVTIEFTGRQRRKFLLKYVASYFAS
jgi:DNA helicase-2/ATP-dependent DNA helicase PcrA